MLGSALASCWPDAGECAAAGRWTTRKSSSTPGSAALSLAMFFIREKAGGSGRNRERFWKNYFKLPGPLKFYLLVAFLFILATPPTPLLLRARSVGYDDVSYPALFRYNLTASLLAFPSAGFDRGASACSSPATSSSAWSTWASGSRRARPRCCSSSSSTAPYRHDRRVERALIAEICRWSSWHSAGPAFDPRGRHAPARQRDLRPHVDPPGAAGRLRLRRRPRPACGLAAAVLLPPRAAGPRYRLNSRKERP